MPNALEEYNAAPALTSVYEQNIRDTSGALRTLIDKRQEIIDGLAAIQASGIYSPEIKTAAQQMAAALRAEILAFADTL